MDQKRKQKENLKKPRKRGSAPAAHPRPTPEAIIKATLKEFAGILSRRADHLRRVSYCDEGDGEARGCFDQSLALSRAARILPEDIGKKILKAAKCQP